MTTQTDPLDDLRRLGMMTEEVESYKTSGTFTQLAMGLHYRLVKKTAADAALNSLAAALVEMKGRRCNSCDHWNPGSLFGPTQMTDPPTPIGSCDKHHTVNVSDVRGDPAPPPDFGCTDWTDRAHEKETP